MNTKVRNATPEETAAWNENDYFMAMKFDPLVLLVAIPGLVQVVVLGFMLASMYITGLIFG